MELSGSDVERVHARMKGAEKWHFSLKIAENCRKRLKFITAYAQLLRFSRNASLGVMKYARGRNMVPTLFT